jgi:sterol desaturase/sphingolipid hydroxylase (fatty acid hydroxylase superfamily)
VNHVVQAPSKRVGVALPDRPNTCRMFESDFLEKFSRIHPLTPFVVYLPVIGAALYRTRAHHVGIGTTVGLFAGGLFTWTLAEYVLHRYVFHWYQDTAFGRRAHFLLHGVHHDFPNDGDRLVMPLLTSAPLAVLFYTLFYFLFGGAGFSEPFFAGFALGYLCYDGTHYAVHHFKQTSRVGKFVKRHHMLHHHADHSGGFGVSTPLWDYVFGTMPQVKKLAVTRAQSSKAPLPR